MAVAHLIAAGMGPEQMGSGISQSSLRLLEKMIEKDLNCPQTSSMGRLFDAVAALVGLHPKRVSHEGQAAIELEALAESATKECRREDEFSFEILSSEGRAETPFLVDASPVIRSVVAAIRERMPGTLIARRFHHSVARMVTEVCACIRDDGGPERVVLSGGVFMNGLLLRETLKGLRSRGFEVFSHHAVPPNDGGICLGQLAVAAALLEKENGTVPRDSGQSHRDLP